jgi:hypothetical protein
MRDGAVHCDHEIKLHERGRCSEDILHLMTVEAE